jgi:hypothetical protein
MAPEPDLGGDDPGAGAEVGHRDREVEHAGVGPAVGHPLVVDLHFVARVVVESVNGQVHRVARAGTGLTDGDGRPRMGGRRAQREDERREQNR